MTINQNSTTDEIKAWQLFLSQQGLSIVGSADGIWGNHTTEATMQFQNSQHLSPDGLVGAMTLAAATNVGFMIPNANKFPPEGLLDVVFDISHLNVVVDLQKAKDAGMMAVFHKASQSLGNTLFLDATYHSRQIEAKKAGLLWGAYHFGSGGSGKDQAHAFLDFVKPHGDTLLVLDFEPNTTHGETTMSVAEAADFVTEIYQQTGKYPGIYSGSLLHDDFVSMSASYDVLTSCWLWKAQYGPTVYLPPKWSDFVFWQYTDGQVGPSALPINGIGHCDRDLFKGTLETLVTFWQNHKV
jgi:lysozyme